MGESCDLVYYRAQLSEEKEVAGQCLVLEPVNVGLSVTRNLAFGWYKELPAVEVGGQLESISVSQRSRSGSQASISYLLD